MREIRVHVCNIVRTVVTDLPSGSQTGRGDLDFRFAPTTGYVLLQILAYCLPATLNSPWRRYRLWRRSDCAPTRDIRRIPRNCTLRGANHVNALSRPHLLQATAPDDVTNRLHRYNNCNCRYYRYDYYRYFRTQCTAILRYYMTTALRYFRTYGYC